MLKLITFIVLFNFWQYLIFKHYKKAHNLTKEDIRKEIVNNPKSEKTNFYYCWFWPFL